MKKTVHDATTGKIEIVDMTVDEIAAVQAMQEAISAREALPKPGEDLLAAVQDATKVADLRAVMEALIRQLFGLQAPAPAVEDVQL